MNIAIIDDRMEDTYKLTKLLKKYEVQYSRSFILDYYKSGEDFLLDVENKKFHLLFMDIYMEKMDGIETVQTLQSIDEECLVVFLTVSKEDVWRAVSTHKCYDYIDKETLDYQRLETVLLDAEEKLHILEKALDFTCGKQSVHIRLVDIQHLVARDKYSVVMLKNGRELCYRISFSSLYEMLKQESNFLLCNRGILLNMDFVEKVNKDVFIMSDEQYFPIRRSDRSFIIQKYQDYQFLKLNEQESVK